MSNIYIIGYRAAGKSSVSEILAGKTSKKIVHMDKMLEERLGKIGEFVKKEGWEKFRDAESDLLGEISRKRDLVVDCGGGVVTKEANIRLIRSTGTAIWLKASSQAIIDRLKKDKQEKRPSLTGKPIDEETRQVLKERTPLYMKASDIQIETDNREVSSIANEILFRLVDTKQIAIVIAEKTADAAISRIKEAERIGELLELRIDHIKGIDSKLLKKIMDSRSKKIIITNRKKSEGGNFAGSEKERLSILNEAIRLDADYVDIEYFSDWNLVSRPSGMKSRLICSYHNFIETPLDLIELYERIKKKSPAIIKIACMGNSYEDCNRMLSLMTVAKKEKINLTGIVMGDFGRQLRIMQVLLGTEIAAYSPLDKNIVAPGQLSFDEMKELILRLR